MNCTHCGGTPRTVGDIRDCGKCYDGTRQQIPGDLPSNAPISEAIAAAPGLANRFLPNADHDAEDAAKADASEQATPEDDGTSGKRTSGKRTSGKKAK